MHVYHAVIFLGLLHFVLSLEVTPNSACSSLCDKNIANGADPSNDGITKTHSSDLVCNDYEYDGSTSTEVGHMFKQCLSCELNSNAVDAGTNQNDVYWALFHMKFTVAWCLFAYPDNTNITVANNQCADICSGPGNTMKPALVDQLLDGQISSQYLYCTEEDGAFSKTTDACKGCLSTIPDTKVLANFLDALNLACDQRPSPEKLLKLDFDVFPSVSIPTPDSATSSSEILSLESSSASASSTTVSLVESSSVGTSSTGTSSTGTSSTGTSSTGTSREESLEAPSAATTHPLYPPSSSLATIVNSTFSAAATSAATISSPAAAASTAVSAKKSQDNVVRMGVGIGVGLGGTAAISMAAGILVWWWRQYDLKLKNEAHDLRKKKLRIRHLQNLPHQDGDGDYGDPELQASDSATRANHVAQPMSLRLSDFIVEHYGTSRMSQLREPDFPIEADVVPPLKGSGPSTFFIQAHDDTMRG